MADIERICDKVEGVKHTVAIAGQSLLLAANASNFGSMYVMLDDFHKRAEEHRSADVISAELKARFEKEVRDGEVNILGAPPVEGLGTAGGFKIVIEDRADLGLGTLETVVQDIIHAGSEMPGLSDLFTSFRANTTWMFLDVDRDAVKQMGISMGDVFNTLQVNLGSLYVNDFNRFGRTWQVNVQADAPYRMQPRDLSRLYVPGRNGQMVPVSTFTHVKEVSGPVMIIRYNEYQSAFVNADAAPGASSGQAIQELSNVANQSLAQGMRAEWTELAFLQLRVGNTAMYAFVLAVVLVFLVLAAQYESWSLPLAVILVVPMCLLCSVAGVIATHMDINIFTQVGFVVLVGLACKNAILIVEFARAARGWHGTARSSAGRLPVAVAADHHDQLRFHLRRGAAGAERRRRRRNAPHSGYGRVLRHVGRHTVRNIPDAGVLQRDPVDFRPAAQARRRRAAAGSDGAGRSARVAKAHRLLAAIKPPNAVAEHSLLRRTPDTAWPRNVRAAHRSC